MSMILAAVTIYGIITAMNGSILTLKTCDGNITVDASAALEAMRAAPLSIDKHVVVTGELEGDVLTATAISNKRMSCL